MKSAKEIIISCNIKNIEKYVRSLAAVQRKERRGRAFAFLVSNSAAKRELGEALGGFREVQKNRKFEMIRRVYSLPALHRWA